MKNNKSGQLIILKRPGKKSASARAKKGKYEVTRGKYSVCRRNIAGKCYFGNITSASWFDFKLCALSGHRVFISSTYEDLVPFRKKVIEFFSGGLLDINFTGMESMPASDVRPIDECELKVRASDIFILVVGERYGWIPDDPIKNPDKLSITQLEYLWALDAYEGFEDKVILRFIADKAANLPADADKVEEILKTKQEKLVNFKSLLRGSNSIVKGFLESDDLVKQINNSLWYKYAGSPFESRIDEEAIYTCNRSDNYFRFKTNLDLNSRFSAFIGVGNTDDVIENFFNRVVRYDFNSTTNILKVLPKRPRAISAEKAMTEHMQKIAFEIDPFKRSVQIEEAVGNYCKKYCGNIYFKTDITLLDINGIKDYVAYLSQLFTLVQQQLASQDAVHFYLFIYSDDEKLHSQLNDVNCIDLGEFEDVGYEDLKSWLAQTYSPDAGIQNTAIENNFLVEENDMLNLFDLKNITNEARKQQKLAQYKQCYGLEDPRRISYPMNLANKLMQQFIKRYNRKELL